MRVKHWALAVLALCATTLVACDDVSFGLGVRGSGTVVTETRDVAGFDAIELQTSGDVVITVTGTDSVTIEAEDNLVPLLTTEVQGGRLELGTSGSISPTEPIVYTITVASLNGVRITGSGDVAATEVDSAAMEVEISGSGNVTATGSADELTVQISGSGNYAGGELIAVRAEVDISGSGNVLVNAADTLDVTISGSGNVEYLGDPAVSQSIPGSGAVTSR